MKNKRLTLNLKNIEAETSISDGYHTFDELYDHRITLYIALCKQITNQPYDNDEKFGVWRSQKHFDGTNYDGWFILGIGKEKRHQITYHIPNERWDETNFADTMLNAPEFDGHTSADVLERIKLL
jgi:hypothetical protein